MHRHPGDPGSAINLLLKLQILAGQQGKCHPSAAPQNFLVQSPLLLPPLLTRPCVPTVTPPGYATDTNTLICPQGEYRAGWKPAEEAQSCTKCGDGMLALQTDRVTVYNPVTYDASELAVTTSADDCCELQHNLADLA
jgi:hypothetical protein